MLALRRLAYSASRAPTPLALLSRPFSSDTPFKTGDPGPATSSFRKQQRSRLRSDDLSSSNTRSRQVPREVLQSIFTADADGASSTNGKELQQPRRERESWQDRLEQAAAERPRSIESGAYRTNRRLGHGSPRLDRAGSRLTTETRRSEGRLASEQDGRGSFRDRGRGVLGAVGRGGSGGSGRGDAHASWRRAIDDTPGQERERGNDDPYKTSDELRRFIQEHFTTTKQLALPDHRDVGVAIAIVTDKPKGAVSVVVWNQLLHLIGRIGQLDKMWSLYNDMKKYGVAPSAHTYTTLLNAYASVPHSGVAFETSSSPVQQKTQSRVSIVWQQAQTYLARPAEQRVETGLAPTTNVPAPSGAAAAATATADASAEQAKLDARAERSRLGPINAYAKFLARYGQWRGLLQLLNDKTDSDTGKAKGKNQDKWDITGYSTVMHGLLNAAKAHKRFLQADLRHGGPPKKIKEDEISGVIGGAAKKVWDGAHRDLYLNQDKRGAFDPNLAAACLQGMMMGSPADQRYALSLIPRVFDVAPAPNSSRSGNTAADVQLLPPPNSDKSAKTERTVKLRLDLPSATALLKTLNITAPKSAAAHFASAFLILPRIRQTADEAMIYAATTAYCNVSDVQSIKGLLEGYSQPWGLAGWKMGFWYDALTAARFAQDWTGLVEVVRWMTLMPLGVEKGAQGQGQGQGRKGGEAFKVERRTVRDLTGKKWQAEVKHELDARCMAIILKAALSLGGREKVGEALRIIDWAGLRRVLAVETTAPTSADAHAQQEAPEAGSQPKSRAHARIAQGQETKLKEWTKELAKEVGRATENMLEGKDEGEAARWKTLQGDAEAYRKAQYVSDGRGEGRTGGRGRRSSRGSRSQGEEQEGRKRMGTDKLWRR